MDYELYVVGQWIASTDKGSVWELQGVFEDRGVAELKCVGHPTYFVAPIKLNEMLPEELVEWTGLYYPEEKNV